MKPEKKKEDEGPEIKKNNRKKEEGEDRIGKVTNLVQTKCFYSFGDEGYQLNTLKSDQFYHK